MNHYRIQLELRSALGTPLAADTLWGHIAWGIRYRGEDSLTEWLDRYDRDDPPLIISDPLPAGFWPRPALPPALRPAAPPDVHAADARKARDKREWIAQPAWNSICDRLSPDAVNAAISDSPMPPTATGGYVLHAAINRFTGGTTQEGGGTLFGTAQSFYDGPTLFDVWALSPESSEQISRWFDDALAGGYGRDAASGLGHLVVKGIEPMPPPAAALPNAVMLLGPAVPRVSDPCTGFFKFGVRSGRVGGDFAIGPLPDGSLQRQKRPVRCLLAGTVLCVDSPVPDHVGRVVSGVHPSFEAIRQYGMTPVLPLQLDQVLLRDLSQTDQTPNLPEAVS